MKNHRPDELLNLLREAFRELRLAELATELDNAVATNTADKGQDDADSRLQWLWRLGTDPNTANSGQLREVGLGGRAEPVCGGKP